MKAESSHSRHNQLQPSVTLIQTLVKADSWRWTYTLGGSLDLAVVTSDSVNLKSHQTGTWVHM